MISTCSSKPETTGLNIQWENLKPCMPQPHWLLHNHCWGPPHWRFLLSPGGGGPSPQLWQSFCFCQMMGLANLNPPFFLSVQMRKTTLWASNPKNAKTHTQNKRERFALWATRITFLKIPNAHKMRFDPQLRKKHLKTNSKHIKKNNHLFCLPIHANLLSPFTQNPQPDSFYLPHRRELWIQNHWFQKTHSSSFWLWRRRTRRRRVGGKF